jgi:hypothetical protein
MAGPPPSSSSPDRPEERRGGGGASGSWDDAPASKKEIETFQKLLADAGFYGGHPDGVWTAAIGSALKKWQKAMDLPTTGKIDGRTRAKFKEIIEFVSGQQPAPAAPASPPAASPAPSTGGGSGSTPAPSGGAAPAPTANLGGTPNPDGKFGIPGGGEIWKGPDNYWYAVYRVPITGTPLAWRIENDDDVAAIFGTQDKSKWRVDKTLSAEDWKNAGVLQFGSSRLLRNTNEHPFDQFVATFETESKVRPWLRDPELMAINVKAFLEGRTPTVAEWEGSNWWQTHTKGERDWMVTYNTDPASAKQLVQDGRDTVRKLLVQSGVSEPPETLVTWLGDRITGGTWTQAYAYGQIAKLADSGAPGELDDALKPLLANTSLNTLAGHTSKVDALVRTWLGPAFAAGWTKQQKESWASRLRNDPFAEEELIQDLREQRKVLYPEYEDDTKSYESIAAPWRGVWAQMWGTPPDETDALFQRVIRLGGQLGSEKEPGGLEGVQQLLRKEGIARGNGTVTAQALSSIGQGFGDGVRGVT